MILLTPETHPDQRVAVPQERVTAVLPVVHRDGRVSTRVFVEGLTIDAGTERNPWLINYVDVAESVQLVARIIDAANEGLGPS